MLTENKGERASYDIDKSTMIVYVPKATVGEAFTALDNPTYLLATAKQRIRFMQRIDCATAGGASRHMKTIHDNCDDRDDSDSSSSSSDDENNDDTEYVQRFPEQEHKADDSSCAQQQPACTTTADAISTASEDAQQYGFANSFSGVFAAVDADVVRDMVDVPDPEHTSPQSRRALRLQREQDDFDEETILVAYADEEGELGRLLSYTPRHVIVYREAVALMAFDSMHGNIRMRDSTNTQVSQETTSHVAGMNAMTTTTVTDEAKSLNIIHNRHRSSENTVVDSKNASSDDHICTLLQQLSANTANAAERDLSAEEEATPILAGTHGSAITENATSGTDAEANRTVNVWLGNVGDFIATNTAAASQLLLPQADVSPEASPPQPRGAGAEVHAHAATAPCAGIAVLHSTTNSDYPESNEDAKTHSTKDHNNLCDAESGTRSRGYATTTTCTNAASSCLRFFALPLTFSDVENAALVQMKLPRLLAPVSAPSVLALTVDLLFAEAYDDLVTTGSGCCESLWNICTLSPALSFLDPANDLYEACIFFARRALIYPLHRHMELVKRVFAMVITRLLMGRSYVIRALLRIRHVLVHAEHKHIFAMLFLNPLVGYWMNQAHSSELLQAAAQELNSHVIRAEPLVVVLPNQPSSGLEALLSVCTTPKPPTTRTLQPLTLTTLNLPFTKEDDEDEAH